ncbi:MAG: protein kinase [Myxococcota bacterium]
MPTSDRRDSLIGTDVGPYRLVRRLGTGGMAEAFEAIRQGPSGFIQHVCLKLVLPSFQHNPDFIRLFQREARLAARLRHRNIVGVIDFGEADGRLYMALELVDGSDLRFLLDQQPSQRMSVEHTALIGVELAEALEHAHGRRSGSGLHPTDAKGIVHRDISPSNVLISRQGEVLLTDFGVAKAMSGVSGGPSAVKGKVPYMSPEQLRAEAPDGRADLFSLGVVLFECLAGGRPYQGAHDPATIMLILKGERLALHKAAPEAPPRLCEVVDSLLEPDPSNRPQGASEVLELLDEYTPSARSRRSLGTLAAESRLEADRQREEVSAVVADGPTENAVFSRSENPQSGAVFVARSEDPSAVRDDLDAGDSSDSSGEGRASSPAIRQPTGRRTRRSALGVTLAVVGVVALGIALLRPTGDAVPAEAGSPVQPVADPGGAATEPKVPADDGAEDAVADDPETPAVAAPEPSQPDAGASDPVRVREPATLSVVVFPWGTVWANGKKLGAAPIRSKRMKPGRYEISVGQGSPSRTVTVRLRPGKHETVRFNLSQ